MILLSFCLFNFCFVWFLFCLVFLFLVETFWPEGAEIMQSINILSEEMISVSALNDLENGLLSGESLVKSWTAFWREIVS